MYADLYTTGAGTVYGAALNFRADLEGLAGQLNLPPYKAPPRAPVLYIKPANTWIADGGVIPLPAGEGAVQVAASLGLVIGLPAARVRETEALTHVVALRLVNDVTLPHESVFRPAIRQRCLDGFCPIGPPVRVPDLGIFLAGCRPRTQINGALRHEWSECDLVRSAAQLLAAVTEFMTLLPGDILVLGAPRSAPTARIGDRIRIEVAGVGTLENRVEQESEVAM